MLEPDGFVSAGLSLLRWLCPGT